MGSGNSELPRRGPHPLPPLVPDAELIHERFLLLGWAQGPAGGARLGANCCSEFAGTQVAGGQVVGRSLRANPLPAPFAAAPLGRGDLPLIRVMFLIWVMAPWTSVGTR